jgi:hypothetical protein
MEAAMDQKSSREDPMAARIAMMKALHRHEPRSESAPRRKRVKYRVVR